jgi:mannosyl-3-phosphoglycerate phosphatase family protein
MVFSDLDGSLLDHHTYAFDAAKPALEKLRANNIPLVLVSSKTRAEIEGIRASLGNTEAFIVENGAAVYLPKSLGGDPPAGCKDSDTYWVYEATAGRAHWLELIASAGVHHHGQYQTFHAAGTQGIQAMTGLTTAEAAAANLRDYSEPVAWLGSADDKQRFVADLKAAGASVQQGGRFLSVSGDCDKGRAVLWLRQYYQQLHQVGAVTDIAIGDSGNDVAMLEVAGTALLIRSPNHNFPSLQRTAEVMRSDNQGPLGWNEGVTNWLASQGIT